MEEFNLSKINIYSIDELVEFILSGSTTKEQLYKNGLFRPNRPLLEKALALRDRDDWEKAREEGSEAAILAYLSIYDKDEPLYKGLFVEEAKSANKEPIEIPELFPEPKSANISEEISKIVSSLYYNASRRELSSTDNTAWLKATSKNTIHSYEEYLRVYKNNPWGYEGKHVEDAKKRILQHQEASAWHRTTIAKTKDAYNEYISKYEPIKHLLSSNHLDDAKKWLATPSPSSLFKLIQKVGWFVAICLIICVCIWAYKYFTKPDAPQPLSSEEIAQIIQEKQDSLKIDLFNGFYLTPAHKGQGEDKIAISSMYMSDNTSSESMRGPLTKKEVIADFVSTLNGKYNIANKDGIILEIPEANNGIDSICLKNAPFVEYYDNNGLRRVVVLFNDDVYYYLGECVTLANNKLIHIICDKEGNKMLIDDHGFSIKEGMFYDVEAVGPNHFAYKEKSDSKWTYCTSSGNDLAISVNYPSDAYISSTGLVRSYNPNSNYDSSDKYGFQDLNGEIIIPYQYRSAGHFSNKGYAVVGLGKKTTNKTWIAGAEKYGIIDQQGRTIIPFEYDYISLGESDTIKIAKKGLYGLMKISTKEIVVPCKYQDCSVWFNGFCVKENDKYYFIDSNQNRIINDTFEYAQGGHNNLTLVKKNGRYYFINIKGEKVFDTYDKLLPFDFTGLACATKGGRTGFIDLKGSTAIPFIFDTATPFNKKTHLSQVKYNGVLWYINSNGAFCYPAEASKFKPYDQIIQAQIEIKSNNDRKRR